MAEDEVFVRFEPDEQPWESIVRIAEPSYVGFSMRMAELGAFVVEIQDEATLFSLLEGGQFRCRGLFARSWDAPEGRRRLPPLPVPVVGWFEHADREHDDCVEWDDLSGGRMATEHLVAQGHRSLAVLGSSEVADHWTRRRADGFEEVMTERGLDRQALSMGATVLHIDELRGFGRECALRMAAGRLPEAAVAANDDIAAGFLTGLYELGVPLARWPAIVGFDDKLQFGGQSISSMRLDMREVGRTAADLLWARAHGDLTGPPVVRRLPMQLVPRMTSRAAWAYRLDRLLGGFPPPDRLVSDPELVSP
jgi:DNA-binding LacI/PurR family transcriptional regulator